MFKVFKRNKKPKTPETPQVSAQQKRTSAAVNTTPSSSTPTNTTSSSQPVVNSPPSTPTVITTKSPAPTPAKQSTSVLPTSTSKAADEKLFADIKCKYFFYKYTTSHL
jgi:hypothetical protein